MAPNVINLIALVHLHRVWNEHPSDCWTNGWKGLMMIAFKCASAGVDCYLVDTIEVFFTVDVLHCSVPCQREKSRLLLLGNDTGAGKYFCFFPH